MAYQTLIVEREERIAVVTLNRPPANTINRALVEELARSLQELEGDAEVRVIILTGAGERIFCGGADLSEGFSGEDLEKFIKFGQGVTRRIEQCSKPVIAALNGHATGGGCELACFADLVIASESATFGQPEIKLGVFPPIAALWFPHRIGVARTLQLVLTGDVISAREAERFGLADRVVPPDELSASVASTVARFREKSGPALRLTKRAVLAGAGREFEAGLREIEGLFFGELMKTEDAIEGLRAFLEKRPPVWRQG